MESEIGELARRTLDASMQACAEAFVFWTAEMRSMAQLYRTKRRVEFCETDAAGIVHFASFLCYFEQAEHELLRHVGTSVIVEQPDGSHISWPRVHVECDFQGAAKFGDELDLAVEVLRIGSRSITYGHTASNSGREIASGKVTAVCCHVRPGQPLQSVAISDSFRNKLKLFVRELE